jgi:hypothetical protein
MKRLYIALFLFLSEFQVLRAEYNSPILNLSDFGATDLQNCKLLLIFARVWKYSPLVETERAVWIVVKSSGEYEAVDWLRTPEIRVAVWSESLPEHIVAQAHTHGDHFDPRPSAQDVSIARKLNIWVYTLTRKGIWRVGPDGLITQQFDHTWFKRSMESCDKP